MRLSGSRPLSTDIPAKSRKPSLLRRSAAAVALTLAALASPALTLAQTPAAPTAAPIAVPLKPTVSPSPAAVVATAPAVTSSEAHALTSADVEAFFDGILPMQLERSDIAGASVLVMQDGQVLLKKGYGYADQKKKTPVDPDTSVFRLASISKLSTWISVMQLVEQGKLNLDTDVNQYLDFPIRPAFGKPVTLRNLMTHTAGFEEVFRDVIITDPRYSISLRDFVIQNQPNRIFPPGQVTAYSNYGVGLASYIVQRASGEVFEQYADRHIYQPLKMTHSSFYQPLPKNLTASEGYREDTTKPAVGFEIFNPVGAGGYSSTAADMGRLGQALLNGGELDGARILKPETLALMWTPQYRASPMLAPICMGFYETWRNQLHWIGHEGDLIAFHSLFFVEPTHKLVLFVSYNSAGGGKEPRTEIINLFSDRYFPGYTRPPFASLSRDDLNAIQGAYQSTRRADTTKVKIYSLMSQRVYSVNKDGELVIDGAKDLRGHAVKFRPIGKDLWQVEGDQDRIFAIRDEHGKVVRLAFDFAGQQRERVPWYENAIWVMPALNISFGILALVVFTSILRTIRRIFMRKRPRLEPRPGTVWLPLITRIACWLWILLLATLFGVAAANEDFLPPNPGWDPWFRILNYTIAVILFFSFFAVLSGVLVWTRNLRWITKVKFTLVAAACVFVSWFAIHWHFIGQYTRI